MGGRRLTAGRRPQEPNSDRRQNRWLGFIRLFDLEFLLVVLVVGSSCLIISMSVTLASNDAVQSPSALPDHIMASKGPILNILKMAQVRLAPDDYNALPSWEDVVRRLGEKPRMIGLESCQTYREMVPLKRRQVAPAGMFSTGTNLLHELLRVNCLVSGRKQQGFVGWQVDWGKHRSPRFRHINYVYGKPGIRNHWDVFPVVMVRDPWTWFQSMCRVRYSAHWFHGTFIKLPPGRSSLA